MKIGDKVWFINHLSNCVEETTLYDASSKRRDWLQDCHSTLKVERKHGEVREVLTEWVFPTKEKAIAGMKKKLKQDIRNLYDDKLELERKLKSLEA